MKKLFSKLLFDRKDHELLKMVQEVLNQECYRMNDFETDVFPHSVPQTTGPPNS